jgi:hypothetical protein
MLRTRRFSGHLLPALVLTALLASSAAAQSDFEAKINDIRFLDDGTFEIMATILDRYGQAPAVAEFDFVELSFGQANTFTGSDLEVTTFADSGRGTDYVLIVPGYEGFGRREVVAAAQGAAWFTSNAVNAEIDTVAVIVYGDGVQVFGDGAEVVELFADPETITRVARPYMLSALDETMRYFFELGPPGRRRVIILVGTGLDVRLGDATRVILLPEATPRDYDNAYRRVLRDHTRILRDYISQFLSPRLEGDTGVGARLYAIGLNENRPDWLEVLDALARKTGGTYRRINNFGDFAPAGDPSQGIFGQIADELDRELLLIPDFTTEGDHVYEVWASFRFPDPTNNRVLNDVATRTYELEVEAYEAKTNVIPYLIAIGGILIAAFLLVVLLYFLVKRLRKQRGRIATRRLLVETIEASKMFCETCYRKMEPDWTSCLFCGSGMGPLEERPQEMADAEEAQKKLDEFDGRTEPEQDILDGSAAGVAAYAAATHQALCPSCGRVMAADWTSCLFCGSDIAAYGEVGPAAGGDVAVPVAFGTAGEFQAPSAMQAPAAAAAPAGPVAGGGAPPAAAAKDVVLTPGGGACPVCNRPVPPDWAECLYCKAGV